jgi:hypothetical protein
MVAMIDHLMTFASQADAMSDPIVGKYYLSDPGEWRGDCCIPHVFAWSPADDIISIIDGVEVVERQPYDTNFRLLISEKEVNSALTSHPACHLVTDRDAAIAGKPFIIQTTLTDEQLTSMAIEPTFHGSSYPFSVASQPLLEVEVGKSAGPIVGRPSFSDGVGWKIDTVSEQPTKI